jgi:dUTPase
MGEGLPIRKIHGKWVNLDLALDLSTMASRPRCEVTGRPKINIVSEGGTIDMDWCSPVSCN